MGTSIHRALFLTFLYRRDMVFSQCEVISTHFISRWRMRSAGGWPGLEAHIPWNLRFPILGYGGPLRSPGRGSVAQKLPVVIGIWL